MDLFDELKDIVDYCCDKYNIPDIAVRRGKGQCSRAGWSRAKREFYIILCPYTVHCQNIYYAYADTLHEVSHIVAYCTSHERQFNHSLHFRETEVYLFADFDIIPTNYARAYWSAIKTTAGKTVYFDE